MTAAGHEKPTTRDAVGHPEQPRPSGGDDDAPSAGGRQAAGVRAERAPRDSAGPFGRVRRSRRLLLAPALLLLAASVAAYVLLHEFTGNDMADMVVYRAEGAAVLNGQDLYGLRVTEWKLPATYPPFAAMLFVPTAAVSVSLLKILVTAGNIALIALLAHLSFRFAGWPPRGLRSIALVLATALGIWLEPIFQTLHFGQINLVITVLVLWDLSRPDSARTKGVALGVAAGIKLTPGIFAVYLLLTGRIRAGIVASGAFLGTAALGWGVLPGPSHEFWTRRIFETGRVGKVWIVDNQSLQGLVARVLHTEQPGAAWVAVAGITAVTGLIVSARVARGGAEAWGVVCCAATALLISPISWSHHWVWCLPVAVLLAADAARAARGRALAVATAAVLAVFTARSLWLVPKDGDLDLRLAWWHQPLASPYPLLALALLAYAALRPAQRAQIPDGSDSTGPGMERGGYTSSPASSSSASMIR